MSRELALEIFGGSIVHNWYFYLLFFLVSVAGAYIASLIKGFSNERGKYLAIESSLKTIAREVEITTKTSEFVKTRIEHDFWRKREQESIKREKLEGYYLCISSLSKSLNLEIMKKLLGADVEYDERCFEKASMIQALYLPELLQEHRDLIRIVLEYSKFISDGLFDMAGQGKDGVVKARPLEEYMKGQRILNEGLVKPISAALEKSRLVAHSAGAQ